MSLPVLFDEMSVELGLSLVLVFLVIFSCGGLIKVTYNHKTSGLYPISLNHAPPSKC